MNYSYTPRVTLMFVDARCVRSGLVESFLNRRAVISSFITEIMGETTPPPADRTVAISPTPAGVSCKFESYALQELNDRW